jgi:hypothetical protein
MVIKEQNTDLSEVKTPNKDNLIKRNELPFQESLNSNSGKDESVSMQNSNVKKAEDNEK